MRVYRFETSDRQGVFTSGLIGAACSKVVQRKGKDYWSDCKEPCPYRHPNPYTDVPDWGLHNYSSDFHCACSSVEHLLAWFDSEAVRVEMKSLGAVMAVYEVPEADVLQGVAQIMFRRSTATEVERLPIPTLMD